MVGVIGVSSLQIIADEHEWRQIVTDRRGWMRMDAGGRGWTWVDVGGRRWAWVGVDGTWMDGDADVGDYRVECKGNKTYLMYGGQPACDCPMTLKIVVVVVVQWW